MSNAVKKVIPYHVINKTAEQIAQLGRAKAPLRSAFARRLAQTLSLKIRLDSRPDSPETACFLPFLPRNSRLAPKFKRLLNQRLGCARNQRRNRLMKIGYARVSTITLNPMHSGISNEYRTINVCRLCWGSF